MNRDEAKELLPIIQALVEGEKIEGKRTYERDDCWKVVTEVKDLRDMEYRIKQQPEYVPFDYSDAEELIGRTVKSKDGSCIGAITYAGNHDNIDVGTYRHTYEVLLTDYIFLDDSPCGKLKTNDNE